MLPSAEAPESQMERLRWDARDGYYQPSYGRSLAEVFPTLLGLLGRTVPGRAGLQDVLPPDSPRRVKRVLLLCIDAFGYKELSQSQRFQALYGRYGTWITSVFPTITSCALFEC